MKKLFKYIIKCIIEFSSIPFLISIVLISQFKKRKYDVGIGPFPIVTHRNFKTALENLNYTACTFVDDIYHITSDFDIRGDLKFGGKLATLRKFYLFCFSVLNFKCMYLYFNGGPLHNSIILWRIEPILYKLAKIKLVLMPYGGDVQDLTRTNNLQFKNAMCIDYPGHKKNRTIIARKIDIWTYYADHIIGGCDWVDYLYHWDTLCLAHFCVDTNATFTRKQDSKFGNDSLKLFHAPNHTNLKGTGYLMRAVEELNKEGYNICLNIKQKVSNAEIIASIDESDVVIDQLVIGWYGMFALEAMALSKPVVCYIRDDLEQLYVNAGLIGENELPFVKSSIKDIKNTLRELTKRKKDLYSVGLKSREFVVKHHSIEKLGDVFNKINRSILTDIRNG